MQAAASLGGGSDRDSLVEESGARLNRQRLTHARGLARLLAGRPEPRAELQSQIRPRAGAVQQAVIEALARAEWPLRVREVQAAAEELAAKTLSWNTVKDCVQERPAARQRDRTRPPRLLQTPVGLRSGGSIKKVWGNSRATPRALTSFGARGGRTRPPRLRAQGLVQLGTS